MLDYNRECVGATGTRGGRYVGRWEGGGADEWCSHAGGGGDARGENVDHLFVLNVRRLSLITRRARMRTPACVIIRS